MGIDMHTAPAFDPPSDTLARPAVRAGRFVTDAPTRMFHWLFALSFVGAYLSAEGERWRALHVTLGYTMAGLLAFRLLYGLFGPRQASIGMLRRKLGGAPDWLRALTRGGLRSSIHWRHGQNLLMALAVAALLVLVVPLTLSGYATYNDWGVAFGGVLGGEVFAEVHEFFGNAVLAAVLGHLALVAGLSALRRRNLARPMITGRVDGTGPDLVRHKRSWLAALLLVAVLAFVAWDWRQAPNGLMPASAWTGNALDRHRHGDDD
jgi:cytochrome b